MSITFPHILQASLPFDDFNYPVDISRYCLEGTSGQDGVQTWRLIKFKFPGVNKIYQIFNSFVNQRQIVTGEKLREVAIKRALSKETPENSALRQFFRTNIIQIRDRVNRAHNNWEKAKKIKLFTKGFLSDCKILHQSYWREVLHESHFYGQEFNKFFQTWKKSESTINFNSFLDHEEQFSRSTLERVIYLESSERAQYEVTFQDGKLFYQNKPLVTAELSSGSLPIFVISPEGKMYVAVPKVGEFHHSSFLGGASVRGAGEIETDHEGRLIKITTKSGHYKPGKKQLLNTIKFFSSKEISLDAISLIEVSETNKFYRNANKYLVSNGMIQEDGIAGNGIYAEYVYKNNQLVKLKIMGKQYSTPDRLDLLSLALKKIPEEKKLYLTEVVINEGFGINIAYNINEYMAEQGKCNPLYFEGVTSTSVIIHDKEEKVFTLDETWGSFEEHLTWLQNLLFYLTMKGIVSEDSLIRYKKYGNNSFIEEPITVKELINSIQSN